MTTEPDLLPQVCADDIQKVHHFITFSDNDEIWVYREGIYVKNGDSVIKKAIEKAVPDATTHFVNEVVNHIKRRTYVDRAKVGLAEWYMIAVENGVIDLRSGAFLAHDSSRILLNKLPVKYDPKARCSRFFKFRTRLAF